MLAASDNIDRGIIALMYHRFDENKYPSTNIKVKDFIKQINLIKENNFYFINANQFETDLLKKKNKKKILITIDDGFLSFYKNAWPVLKKNKIPFILFVSTKEVGSRGYMNWEQIKEIANENFVHIGNHSHSHGYLIDQNDKEIINDINKSITIFENNLGYNSKFFSYPFGEYGNKFKKIVKDLGFKYAFGQHSGVIDETKNFYELPRYPINEKYGELERFKLLLNTLPLKVKSITPTERYINNSNNPPNIIINFYEDIKGLKNLKCYSNENNIWRESNIKFLNNSKLQIILEDKFKSERGRVNCSLRDESGMWRWLGLQFVIAEF